MLWGRGLAYSNKYRCILAQEILRESSISSEGRLLIFLLRQHPTNYFIVVNYYKADITHTLVIGITLFRLRTFHLRAIHLLGISPFPGFRFWNPRNHTYVLYAIIILDSTCTYVVVFSRPTFLSQYFFQHLIL